MCLCIHVYSYLYIHVHTHVQERTSGHLWATESKLVWVPNNVSECRVTFSSSTRKTAYLLELENVCSELSLSCNAAF